MTINGEIIRTIRKNLGLSQESFAEKIDISSRQVSRIENNETTLELWSFIKIAELLHLDSSDFWLLYLTTEEYEGYRKFKKLQRYFNQDRMEESIKMLNEIENNPISKVSHVEQTIKHMRIMVDYLKSDIGYKERLFRLYKIISVPNFEEQNIEIYQLNQNDMKILNHIAVIYCNNNQLSRGMHIFDNPFLRRRHNDIGRNATNIFNVEFRITESMRHYNRNTSNTWTLFSTQRGRLQSIIDYRNVSLNLQLGNHTQINNFAIHGRARQRDILWNRVRSSGQTVSGFVMTAAGVPSTAQAALNLISNNFSGSSNTVTLGAQSTYAR